MRKRSLPIGVMVIGGLNILGGGLICLLALASCFIEGGEPAGLLIAAIAAIPLILGIGLVMLRRWARIGSMIGYGLNIVGGLFLLPASILGVGVSALILMYLSSTGVHDAFDWR